ncbi:MAG: ChuX/HutX family heme-like substrate-binding protein [Variibacter sp.]
MTDATSLRQRLTASPEEILQRLPQAGRVMIIANDRGVTHERIGTVESVEVTNGEVRCRGKEHDSVIVLSPIAAAIADRSGRMKDKVLPRLNFQDANAKTIFSIVGMDGLEPFDRAFAAFSGASLDADEPRHGEPATVSDDDPAAAPLQKANESQAEIAVTMQTAAFRQRWQGAAPAIKLAMGFVNIITPDFHLHVRGGAVARWASEDLADGKVKLSAIGQDGQALGLVLTGPAAALRAG